MSRIVRISVLLFLVAFSEGTAQYQPGTFPGIGTDSIDLSYVKAFNPDSTLRLDGRIHILGIMPEAGVEANFWKTYATGVTDSNTTTEDCLSDSIAIPRQSLIPGMSLKVHAVFLFGHSNATPSCGIRFKWGDNNLDSITYTPASVSNNSSPMIVDWWLVVKDSVSGRVSWSANYFDGNVWKFAGSTSMADFTLWSGDFNTHTKYLHFSSKWSTASILNKTRITFLYGSYADRPN